MKQPVFLFFAFLVYILPLAAQSEERPATLEAWAERVERFGRALPQEEVYVHMDNTCYFVSDTLYYKVYARRGDTGRPSSVSGLMYVELLSPDGYLVERQKVRMERGAGTGSFVLRDSLYAGYYELRAYTRWQLNFGQTVHPHTKNAERWFYSRRMAAQYFRDYDRLYQRVFPVYDRPKTPGDYTPRMTERPLQRYFKAKYSRPEAEVRFYPEGGNLVIGVPQRVAFEAREAHEGYHLDGTLTIKDQDGRTVATASTENRGRGTFDITVQEADRLTATFLYGDSLTERVRLPRPMADGVSLRATERDDSLIIELHAAGQAANEELGLTLMHGGALIRGTGMERGLPARDAAWSRAGSPRSMPLIKVPLSALPEGVCQLTVYNAEGRVWADRLIFVRPRDFTPQTLTIEGAESEPYKPYSKVTLTVSQNSKLKTQNSSLSLAVRDADHGEYTFDTGTILTEMLLASQIRGFVEKPEYYFEADDARHRRHLDLLLLTQGWRRYAWQTMATPGAFTLSHMPERTETLVGEVLPYQAEEAEDVFSELARQDVAKWEEDSESSLIPSDAEADEETTQSPSASEDGYATLKELMKDNPLYLDGRTRASSEVATTRFNENQGSLKREVRVHAEFVKSYLDAKADAVEGDVTTTQGGIFRIEAPAFEDKVVFHLAASDTTRWKAGHPHTWVALGTDKNDRLNYPEYYVRLNTAYPRFVKPYTYYQAHLAPPPSPADAGKDPADGSHVLREVTVGAKRSGLHGFAGYARPAYVVDAYEAFNEACDAGLTLGYFIGGGRFTWDVARLYVADMNQERSYDVIHRWNGKPATANLSPGEKNTYNLLTNLDKVYLYTDYAPRREGDPRYTQSNQPTVTIDLHRYEDSSRRLTYRDRRYILTGYNVPAEFYSPDYSHAALPPCDYRRTLYWNPDLQLDAEGRCTVEFYTGSRPARLEVEAEGMGAEGELLTGHN